MQSLETTIVVAIFAWKKIIFLGFARGGKEYIKLEDEITTVKSERAWVKRRLLPN